MQGISISLGLPTTIIVLDFNLAYSPLCAFDEKKYGCPLPPSENWDHGCRDSGGRDEVQELNPI
ncbi:DUF1684 domain-containing protein [Candidatus Bathyarchaeota archaeon]|nr:MAG: DUF1684 domain-containing protein [Candidatus Bathyarchaeota archaeon]